MVNQDHSANCLSTLPRILSLIKVTFRLSLGCHLDIEGQVRSTPSYSLPCSMLVLTLWRFVSY